MRLHSISCHSFPHAPWACVSISLGELSNCEPSVFNMAAHVRSDRGILAALEWLGQTDPGQLVAVCRTLPAPMRSSLIASIGSSFAATDDPGPSASASDQPWLASGALHSNDASQPKEDEPKNNDPWNPPQSGDALQSEAQTLRGHAVRRLDIIACREPCQRCTLAMCGFQTENPLDSHFAGSGKHACKRCYRSIRERNIGSTELQPQDSSWQDSGSWWGSSWGSRHW